MISSVKIVRSYNFSIWIFLTNIIENNIAEIGISIAFARIEAIDFFNKAITSFSSNFPKTFLEVKGEVESNIAKKSSLSLEDFYREKLAALKAQRKQIEFDMEQEAEPEGGPVADYYGEALQHIDDQIDSIKDKMHKNESSLITKGGLQEMRTLPLEDRILRNLKGNDYILRETFKK